MPAHCPAVLTDCPRPADDIAVFRLRAYPSAVRAARSSVTAMLSGLVPNEHLEDLQLCTSELVTNAYRAATRYADHLLFGWSDYDTPICLGVLATARWTRLDVRDPEPYMRPAEPTGLMDETGRGLGIVQQLGGHLAHTIATRHKVVHAVLPICGALTEAELDAAFPLGARR